MKQTLVLLAALAALVGCSKGDAPNTVAAAPEVAATADAGRGEGKSRREAMMKEMDKDGDGKLSDQEKSAAFDARVAKSERYRQRVDTDGDGKVSAAEKAEAMKRFMRPRRDGERRERRDRE